MNALITPRTGRAVADLSVAHYGPFYAGQYRGRRDVWLVMARNTHDVFARQQRIRFAIEEHRSMMRAMREAQRDARTALLCARGGE